MINDQEKALRCAYTMMKEKLLKFYKQVRRKHLFSIARVLDPRFKLGHILHDDHNFFMKTLHKMLESVHIMEALSFMPIGDHLASLSHKPLKVMMQFMEP